MSNNNNIKEQKDRKHNTYWTTGHQHSQMEDDYSEESNPDSIYMLQRMRKETILLCSMECEERDGNNDETKLC